MTILIISSFFIKSFSSSFILLDYVVNKPVYEMKCLNKTKPKMRCHGRCQMMKKLQEEERKEQQDQEKYSDNKTEPLSSRSFFASVLLPEITDHVIIKPLFITTGKVVQRTSEIFHPPKKIIC